MTPGITFSALVKAIKPDTTECRATDRKVIMIAGSVGCIKDDLSVNLRLAALHGAAKQAAVDLYDSGVFDAHADGQPFIARMPSNFTERRLLRQALGLKPQSRDVA